MNTFAKRLLADTKVTAAAPEGLAEWEALLYEWAEDQGNHVRATVVEEVEEEYIAIEFKVLGSNYLDYEALAKLCKRHKFVTYIGMEKGRLCLMGRKL